MRSLAAALLLLVGCTPPAPPPEVVALTVNPDDGAFTVSRSGAGYQDLRASFTVGGVERFGAGAPTLETSTSDDALGRADETRVTWGAGAYTLTLSLRRYDGFVSARVRVACASACPAGERVEGLSVAGTVLTTAGEPRAALVDGYQSWSPTYFAALQRDGAQEDTWAFTGNNDGHLVSDARLSWWVSAMALGDEGVAVGALTAATWKTRVLTWRQDGVQVRVRNGGGGDSLPASAQGVESELLFFGAGDGLTAALTTWGRAVAKVTPPPAEPFVPRGWNSWNTLFEAVSEARTHENADRLLALAALQPNLAQVDDGWQRQWGDWNPNAKFPSGLAGLSSALAAKGLHTGLWMAPFFLDRTTATAQAHPEWFLRDARGAFVTFGDFFTGATYQVLDGSHPEARAWMVAEVQRALDAGVRALKLDFLFAGAWEGVRHEDVTALQAFSLVMREVLAAAQAKGAYVVACGAPVLPSAGLAHALRTGEDIAARGSPYTWPWVKNASRNVGARWFVSPFIQSDPDTLLVRELPPNERRVHATVTLLAGRVVALGDDLPTLTADEWGFLEHAVALPSVASLGAEGFVPLDAPGPARATTLSKAEALVDAESYGVPSVWATRGGQGGTLVGLVNWKSEAQAFSLDGAAVGLTAGAQVDELWQGLEVRRADGKLEVTVPAHDAAYLHLR